MSAGKCINMNEIWKAAGAAAWGAVRFSGLRPFLEAGAKEALAALCPGAETVLVAAFPYYAGDTPGNLSLYCRGEDYHRVLARRLGQVCGALEERYPGGTFVPGADNSPVPERTVAELAGVGFQGRHGLRILPPYGSYLFLGTILTDLQLPEGKGEALGKCPPNCHACQDACPTGALGAEGFQPGKCLSALTQEKGALSPEVAEQIKNSPTVWGCDLCQKACPFNRNVALSPLPEFRENLLTSLSLGELEGLSNRAFRRKYGDRAFAWRGIGPLVRNLGWWEEAKVGSVQPKPPS